MIIQLKDIPVTPINQLYTPILRNGIPSICKSKVGRSNEKLLRMSLLMYAPKKPLEGNLSIKIDFCIKDKNKDKDIDAILKQLLDGLEGIVYRNDR